MKLFFSPYSLRTKKVNQIIFVFDVVRKKFVQLSPEEFVRQQVIHFILDKYNYPIEAFAVEKQIRVGELKKRFDIVIYKEAKPWMIIECKKHETQLTQFTLQQIVEYNMQLKASYLLLANGNSFLGYKISSGELQVLKDLPKW